MQGVVEGFAVADEVGLADKAVEVARADALGQGLGWMLHELVFQLVVCG